MKPALLGGEPAFSRPLPFAQPSLPPLSQLQEPLGQIWETGMLSKGPMLAAYEEEVARSLGVKQVVAMSNCTAGLMLTLQAMNLRGDVLVPSFTFPATIHALLWNNLNPVFVECDPLRFTIDPGHMGAVINANVKAVLAVYIFGNPPQMEALTSFCHDHHLELITDAASAMGTLYRGDTAGGWGLAEIISTSATKLLSTGEGGLVATNDSVLAARLRAGREYGNPGDYDCLFPGLNARLTEFQAAVGRASLPLLPGWVENRNAIASLYRNQLGLLPGIDFQEIEPLSRSSYKDFAILVDAELFGLDRDQLGRALAAEGIATRKYFFPPTHLQQFWLNRGHHPQKLPVTERVAGNILCLPIFSHMSHDDVRSVCAAITRIHKLAGEVRQAVATTSSAPGGSS